MQIYENFHSPKLSFYLLLILYILIDYFLYFCSFIFIDSGLMSEKIYVIGTRIVDFTTVRDLMSYLLITERLVLESL